MGGNKSKSSISRKDGEFHLKLEFHKMANGQMANGLRGEAACEQLVWLRFYPFQCPFHLGANKC